MGGIIICLLCCDDAPHHDLGCVAECAAAVPRARADADAHAHAHGAQAVYVHMSERRSETLDQMLACAVGDSSRGFAA